MRGCYPLGRGWLWSQETSMCWQPGVWPSGCQQLPLLSSLSCGDPSLPPKRLEPALVLTQLCRQGGVPVRGPHWLPVWGLAPTPDLTLKPFLSGPPRASSGVLSGQAGQTSSRPSPDTHFCRLT